MEVINTLQDMEKAVEENEMVLFYFGMASCVVCVDLLPKVDEMLKKFPKIKAYEIKAEENISLAAKFDVFTAPVIVMYIQGKEGIREARHISIPDLEGKISRYYDMLFN